MKKMDILKLVISILLLILGIWSESILPFLGIVILMDTIRKKSYFLERWKYAREQLGKWFAWVEWMLAILLALWVIIFIQKNFIGIYTFQTSSMHQTLQVGDVLLVNKLVPGPRHGANKMKKYDRSKGIANLAYLDAIIFNFPEGDTLLKSRPTESYHYLKRLYRENGIELKQQGELRHFKVDDRPRFVKRIYGLPGDSIVIDNGIIYANEKRIDYPQESIDRYIINESTIELLKKEGIEPYNELKNKKGVNWELLEKDYQYVQQFTDGVKPDYMLKNFPDRLVFPFDIHLLWNMHHMGPIYIPKRGDKIELNARNILFYRRAIEIFEENAVRVKGEMVWINNKPAFDYTFKMNYYWVVGDNRPHSFDSRFWGFVPENHIIGKVSKVLLSRDTNKEGWIYLRKNRFLKDVK